MPKKKIKLNRFEAIRLREQKQETVKTTPIPKKLSEKIFWLRKQQVKIKKKLETTAKPYDENIAVIQRRKIKALSALQKDFIECSKEITKLEQRKKQQDNAAKKKKWRNKAPGSPGEFQKWMAACFPKIKWKKPIKTKVIKDITIYGHQGFGMVKNNKTKSEEDGTVKHYVAVMEGKIIGILEVGISRFIRMAKGDVLKTDIVFEENANGVLRPYNTWLEALQRGITKLKVAGTNDWHVVKR